MMIFYLKIKTHKNHPKSRCQAWFDPSSTSRLRERFDCLRDLKDLAFHPETAKHGQKPQRNWPMTNSRFHPNKKVLFDISSHRNFSSFRSRILHPLPLEEISLLGTLPTSNSTKSLGCKISPNIASSWECEEVTVLKIWLLNFKALVTTDFHSKYTADIVPLGMFGSN